MSVVRVGPYKRIIGFHWPTAESVVLAASFDWWGVGQGIFHCTGSSDPGLPSYLKVYSPAFFATSFKLWPNRSAYDAGLTDGVLSINGSVPADSGFTYSGMPVPVVHSASLWSKIALNLDFLEGGFLDNRLQRLEPGPDPLSADFVLYSPNTSGIQWCVAGNIWQDLDSRFWTGTEVDLSYTFEAFRETMDFSGLTVTRVADGQVYAAASVAVSGDNLASITLNPV